jgi:quinol monooxygenase YgiN
MQVNATLFLAVITATLAFRPALNLFRGASASSNESRQVSSAAKNPIALFVTVEIKQDRIEEFTEVMKIDAASSVSDENGGCLRFDVLSHGENSNKFSFYEVYKDSAAFEFHQTTKHFKMWSDFKETGAVLSLEVKKMALPITATFK